MARKMKLNRENAYKAIEESLENVQGFIEMQKSFSSRGKNFSAVEFLQSLPRDSLSQVWVSLSALCLKYAAKIVVQEGGDEDEDDPIVINGDVAEVIGALNGVIALVHTYVSKHDDSIVTEDLLKIVKTLHDLLLIMFEVSAELQNKVSLLCESWWSHQLKDRDQVIQNTILYVVLRSVGEGAAVADVKRVWSMRSALLLLDFEDESINSLKEMLLMTIISPLYLKSDEGCKFISFLFGLHPKFSFDVHRMIKHQLAGSPGWVVDVYGRVYLKAWRLAEGPYLTLLEERCIQDLMFSAVHAPRVRPNELFQVFRRVLNHFHEQANQRQVQEMLHRLYKPILWRSLRVANDHVRVNAVTLMMDAFPLVDPQGTKEVVDTEIQKQIDILKELLMDPTAMVRVSVIVGVCRLLSCFWDMLPVSVIRDLLTLLVSDLAFDSSSINVRVAVIQGLCILLEQRLSHPVLKDLLPLLGGHLHDTAERVRLAFLDMLILVKGMRSIKVWNVCPIDHLLARMENDSLHVVRRIVTLLMDSLNIADQGLNLKKCLILLESNQPAAWRLYQCSLSHMAMKDTVRFMLSILRFVKKCIKTVSTSVPHEQTKALNGVTSLSVGEISMEVDNNGGRNSDVDQTEEESLVGGDSTSVARLLEVVLILMEGCRSKFKKGVNKKLINELAELLPELVEYFEDSSMHHLLYRLGSFVPKDRIPILFKGSIDCLLTQQLGEDHEPLLTALVVGWDQGGLVLQHIKRGLELGLDGSEKENRGSLRKNSKKRGKSFDLPLWPAKSLEVLSSLLSHPLLFDKVKDAQECERLLQILKKSMLCAENILLGRSCDSEAELTPSFITGCFKGYMKTLLHTRAEFNVDIEDQLQEAIAWCERVVLETLAPTSNMEWNPKKMRNRKRKSDQSDPIDNSLCSSSMANTVLEDILSLLSDALITGLCPESLDAFISQFLSTVIKKVGVAQLFPQLSNLLYQLIELCSFCSDECLDNMSVHTRLALPASLMQDILQKCIDLAETDVTLFHKVWSSLKTPLTKGIDTSIRHSYLSLPNSVLPFYGSMVQLFLTAYSTQLAKNISISTPSSVDDLPLFLHQLLALVCKERLSTRLFLTHLDNELEGLDVSERSVLAHLSVLHLICCLCEKLFFSSQLNKLAERSRDFLQSGQEVERLKANYPELVDSLNQRYKEISQILLSKC